MQDEITQIASLLEDGRASDGDTTSHNKHIQILGILGGNMSEDQFDEIEEVIADYMNDTSAMTSEEAALWIVETKGEINA